MSTPTGADARHPPYPTDPGSFVAPAAPQPARWGNLPQELRERPQWLLAAPTKEPYTPTATGYARASVNTPAQWLPFDVAAAHAAQHPGCGIGYVLAADDPFTCIDLDVKDHTTPEQLERFGAMATAFDCYTERSVSGHGLHIWCLGNIGAGVRRDGVEMYSQERFIICTGDVYLNRPLLDRQQYLDNMVSQMRALGTPPVALVELPALESDYEHWARKVNSRAGPKFTALWGGAWRKLGYPSQSEADLALIRMLCFNNPSNEQVRRMFRASALGQRKKAARVDYVDGMIAAARGAEAQRAAQLASAWVGGGPPPLPARPGL